MTLQNLSGGYNVKIVDPDGPMVGVLSKDGTYNVVANTTGFGILWKNGALRVNPTGILPIQNPDGSYSGSLTSTVIGSNAVFTPNYLNKTVYDPDALSFFARLTNQPTDARKKLYSDLVVSLKAAGVWAKLDALYILAAADAQAARQNLVANAYNLTAVNVPAFTVDRDYTGDGSASYLATSFNPTTAPSPKFVRDSACIFTWERSALAAATTSSLAASAGNRVSLVPRSTGDIIRSSLNGLLGGSLTIASNVGLTASDRINSTDVLHIKDGSLVETVTVASEDVSSGDFDLMRRNGAVYRASPMTVAGFGASLGTTGHAALRTALNTYLNAVGAV